MMVKVVVFVVAACAVVCSAQIHADCDPCLRRDGLIAEPVYRVEPVPIFRTFSDDGSIIHQRSDPRSYPVFLSNDAPETALPPVISVPPIVTPVRERPIIRLPHAPIPPPRVVSHKCTCTKTVVKPQIIQRVITVPKIQRYVRRGFKPVVENVEYLANARTFEERPTRFVEDPVAVLAECGQGCLPPQFSQVSSIC